MTSASEDPPTSTSFSSNPTKPLRFKRPRTSSPSPSEPPRKRRSLSPPSSNPQNPHHSRLHHHHHHHHHRRRRSPKRQPHTPPENPNEPRQSRDEKFLSMDPDMAFRESLFDALADDEGAAFWEGVYGQPIHTYSPYYPASTSPPDDAPDDPNQGKLEKMTDEQYVKYVRRKMWEKSHEHILDEQRRRAKERERKKARGEKERKWQAGVEEALRRGEERRERNRWKGAWEGYLAGWGKGKGKIVWPVESGKMRNVGTKGEIEKFFKGVGGVEGVDLGDALKKERVRWHPDKMQQRAGDVGIDARTLKVVTAVFQVVDRLWSEIRERI